MSVTGDFIDPPQVWYVWDGQRLYMPYPGGFPAGGKEVVDRIVAANPETHRTVQMEVTFAEEGHECDMRYSHSEPNYGAHYECQICGAKSP